MGLTFPVSKGMAPAAFANMSLASDEFAKVHFEGRFGRYGGAVIG